MAEVIARYKEAFGQFARGELDAAIQGYKEVIAIDASFSLAHQALSEAYARKGDLDSAVGAIRRAIEVDPHESLYYTSLSRFLQRQGKIPEAEEAAARAARVQAEGPL
jgi:tetratricopeptide (TPR) repeat protein